MAEQMKMGVVQLADTELRAMRNVMKVVEPLPLETQVRVLNWALERAKGPVVLTIPAQPAAAAQSEP